VARPALEQAEMTCIPGFRALIASAINTVVGWKLLNFTSTSRNLRPTLPPLRPEMVNGVVRECCDVGMRD
jgi:hypothetical protein